MGAFYFGGEFSNPWGFRDWLNSFFKTILLDIETGIYKPQGFLKLKHTHQIMSSILLAVSTPRQTQVDRKIIFRLLKNYSPVQLKNQYLTEIQQELY